MMHSNRQHFDVFVCCVLMGLWLPTMGTKARQGSSRCMEKKRPGRRRRRCSTASRIWMCVYCFCCAVVVMRLAAVEVMAFDSFSSFTFGATPGGEPRFSFNGFNPEGFGGLGGGQGGGGGAVDNEGFYKVSRAYTSSKTCKLYGMVVAGSSGGMSSVYRSLGPCIILVQQSAHNNSTRSRSSTTATVVYQPSFTTCNNVDRLSAVCCSAVVHCRQLCAVLSVL